MIEREEIEKKVLEELCKTIDSNRLNPTQILNILIDFMYTLGLSIENIDDISTEDLLMRYASNPTIGIALIAQARFMHDTWLKTKIGKENE